MPSMLEAMTVQAEQVVSRTIAVCDPDDPRIAAFRDIRERDLVGRDGRFIAEGAVVLRHLVDSPRHRPLALLLAEARVAGLGDLIDGLPEDVPVYTAAQPVIDRIAGFPLHRGILALGQRAPDPGADALLAGLSGPALVVVLVGIANHDNVGGIFRNAAAFGADAVLLDPACCDPLYRKAIRVSVGAALRVPFARLARDEDPVALLARHAVAGFALTPRGATDLDDVVVPERAALVFGTEGEGLPAGLIARLPGLSIAMAPGFDSLNVATASGIALARFAAAGRRR